MIFTIDGRDLGMGKKVDVFDLRLGDYVWINLYPVRLTLANVSAKEIRAMEIGEYALELVGFVDRVHGEFKVAKETRTKRDIWSVIYRGDWIEVKYVHQIQKLARKFLNKEI